MRTSVVVRLLTVAGVCGAGLVVTTSAPALAVSPGTTGQPGQTCLSPTAPDEPGRAASAPGSAFNEVSGIAGGVYAGSQPQSSKNPKSVSQYDVACFQVSH